MPPPDQAGEEAEAEDGEEGQLIQSYLNVAYQQPQEAETATVLVTNPDEENPNGVTYFVDEHGRYYYQPNTEEQTIMSITTPVNTSNVLQEGLSAGNILEDGYQTVTLVPSESDTGEVSYVLVVQEEKPVINLDIKIDQDEIDEQVQKLDRTLEQELELAQEQAEAEAEQEQEQEQDIGNDDVYTFDEENIEEVSEEEEVGRRKRVTKRRNQRTKFTCTFCHYTSHRRYLLLRHMKTHSEDRPYKCKVCDRGFKTMASLQNHVNMHNGVKPHVCQFCKSPFTTSGELVRHVRYRHTHEKPHKCSECDYASVELSKLRRHVRCHTGERPYQCPDCTYASPDTFKLKRHIRTHTGEKPYKCDSCNMCFTQSNSLKAHRLIHNVAEKPVYRCELCPAKCGRKTDLRIHIQKLHTSDKPQKCKRCGKSFPDRYSCKVHNKTHEGEKCFKCDLCPYASTMLRHLKSHMLKHTDEKPFACTECDQSFRQKQLLRRHHNLYHNPDYVPKPAKEKTHACHDCKRIFAHKGNLIRHLAIHDPDSGHNEQALALRLGRQRKVKFNKPSAPDQEEERTEDGDLVKMGLTNTELRRGELVTVADGDGQQYVVLEVIQLEDGTEQHVAVVAPEYIECEDEQAEEQVEEEQPEDMEEEPEQEMRVRDSVLEKSIKLEKDVNTCFGFDEDGDDGEDEDYEMLEARN